VKPAADKQDEGAVVWHELRQGVSFTVVMMLLVGGGYHGVLWGIGRIAFAGRADGSLLRRQDGTILGSRLIAQKFVRREYFHPRPSAVDYNAAATGGSNYGPSNPDHLRLVEERLDAVMQEEGVAAREVPSEMVTASGAGIDPHIPPRAAAIQARRVARARGVALADVEAVIAAHTEAPTSGILGRSRVNVLELNLALDAAFGRPGKALDTALAAGAEVPASQSGLQR
jgi:potassium-transporting ATPase KdpC subunit